MFENEEDEYMGVVKNFSTTWEETKNEELFEAVNELRELGEEIEKNDPHFFEEEKYIKIIKLARKVSRKIPNAL